MARQISAADLDAARRLKAIYESKKYGPERLTQVKLREAMGFSQQVTISQYLNGKISLGIEATAKFANVLGVEPTDIRPDFYSMLPIKPPPAETVNVPVRGSMVGETLDRITIKIYLGDSPAVSHYAVLVDTSLYRKNRIREGSHLVLGEDLELQRDDDVYIELESGEKHIATFIGRDHSAEEYIVRCLATDEILELPYNDVVKIDVIIAVRNPADGRPPRAK